MSLWGGPVICPHCGQDVTRLPNAPSVEDIKAAMERFLKEQQDLKEPKLERSD